VRRPTVRDVKRIVGRGLVPDLARERKPCELLSWGAATQTSRAIGYMACLEACPGAHRRRWRLSAGMALAFLSCQNRVAFRSVVMAAPLRTGRGRVHLRPRLHPRHTVLKACRILYAARCRRAPTRANQRRRNCRLRGRYLWSLRELRRRMCAERTRLRRLPSGFDRSKAARRSGRTCRTCDRCAESIRRTVV